MFMGGDMSRAEPTGIYLFSTRVEGQRFPFGTAVFEDRVLRHLYLTMLGRGYEPMGGHTWTLSTW